MSEPDKDGSEKKGMSPADVEHLLYHHSEFPETSISRVLDPAMSAIGKAASWLWVVTVGVIIYAVVGRYAFSMGTIMLEEIMWHIAGAAWLLGLGYTLVVDDHVRVDVIHERPGPKTHAWIEFLGLSLLLLPFLYFAVKEGIPYAYASFTQGERSQAPAGLTNRWVLKSIMVLGFALIAVAAVSRLTKVTALLFGLPKPMPPKDLAGDAK